MENITQQPKYVLCWGWLCVSGTSLKPKPHQAPAFPTASSAQGAAGCVYLGILYLLENAEFSLQFAPEVIWAAQEAADTVC